MSEPDRDRLTRGAQVALTALRGYDGSSGRMDPGGGIVVDFPDTDDLANHRAGADVHLLFGARHLAGPTSGAVVVTVAGTRIGSVSFFVHDGHDAHAGPVTMPFRLPITAAIAGRGSSRLSATFVPVAFPGRDAQVLEFTARIVLVLSTVQRR